MVPLLRLIFVIIICSSSSILFIYLFIYLFLHDLSFLLNLLFMCCFTQRDLTCCFYFSFFSITVVVRLLNLNMSVLEYSQLTCLEH